MLGVFCNFSLEKGALKGASNAVRIVSSWLKELSSPWFEPKEQN